MFESEFQAPAFEGARAGAVDKAKVTNAQSRAGASAKRKELEKKIQALEDKNDPSKFQKIVNITDGGFDFFDGGGEAISPIEYAQALGRSPLDILADSGRLSDREFANDYEAILNLNVARESGNYDSFFEQYPELKEGREQLLQMNNEEMMNLLFQQYPSIIKFGEQNPEAETITKDAGGNFIQDFFGGGSQVETGTFLNTFPRGDIFDEEGELVKKNVRRF